MAPIARSLVPVFLGAAPLLFPVSTATAASVVSFDEGDEESAFIAGLAEKNLHDLVVREGQKFLKARASHRRAPIVRYRVANAQFALNEFEAARKDYEVLERRAGFEHGEEVRFRLGQCELRRDAFAAAEEDFAAVVAGSEDYLKVPATFLLGEARFRGRKYKEAAEAYGAVLSAEGGETYAPDARHGLVWCAWRLGDADTTVSLAEDFLKRHASDERTGEVAFLAGEAHLDAGRPADAEAAYRRVSGGPYADAALRGLAFAAAGRGEYRTAAARFGELLKQFPGSRFAAEAALQQGVHLVRGGDALAGLQVLERPPAVDDATNRYWRARALALVGDHENALDEARAGLGMQPDDTLAVQLRIAAGDALFELGREGEAAQMYETSGSAYALHAAAVAKLNAGEMDEAERLAKTLLDGAAKDRGAPYRVETLLVRGEALFRLERYSQAEPLLRAVLEEGQGEAVDRARARLAWCDWYANEPAAAARGFAQVADRATGAEAEEAAYMAGRASIEAGDEPGARAAFERYLQRFPEGANAADALLRLSRLVPEAEAGALLARLAEGFGDAPEAERALVALADSKSAAGDHAGAIEAWRQLLAVFPDGPNAPQARYGLGWSLQQSGQSKDASGPLWEVAGDREVGLELRVAALELLVWVERDAGDANRSRDALGAFASAARAASVEDARVVAAARVAAQALVDAGDAAGAAKLWSDLAPRVSEPSARAAVTIERAWASFDVGDLEGATKLAGELSSTVAQNAPESAGVGELHFFIGEGWYDAGDDARAAAAYLVAATRGDAEVSERALYKAGFTFLRAESPERAAASFGALVERHPKGIFAGEASYLAGEAWYRAGDRDKASTWLQRHLTSAPKHASRPKALYRLGLVQGEQENWTGCATTLSELAAKFPEFVGLVEAELWRGRALARQDQRRAARQALEGVTTRNKGALAAAARVELGRLSEDEGDLDSALSEYLKVAVLYADESAVSEALVRAGGVLEAQGDAERARAQYREVLSRFPDSSFAAEARKRLARLDG